MSDNPNLDNTTKELNIDIIGTNNDSNLDHLFIRLSDSAESEHYSVQESQNKTDVNFILKISGVWEVNSSFGLTYKFIHLSPPLEKVEPKLKSTI
jgi:hypothetical protein